ncbi:hypothetical protein JCM17795_09120 [Galenea microaerophila]
MTDCVDRDENMGYTAVADTKASWSKKPPKLAIGDGDLGFWAAVNEQWPNTTQQRFWVHKTVNVLNKLPRRIGLCNSSIERQNNKKLW